MNRMHAKIFALADAVSETQDDNAYQNQAYIHCSSDEIAHGKMFYNVTKIMKTKIMVKIRELLHFHVYLIYR